MDSKPYSPACERNAATIKACLSQYLVKPGKLLEVGSGTGQHAAYLAPSYPAISWQPSDQADYLDSGLDGIKQWIQFAPKPHAIQTPIALDVLNPPKQLDTYDYIFSANTLHIMGWQAVQAFFKLVKSQLKSQGYLLLYGPFSYDGVFSSESNAQFDASLKLRNPLQGIRDFNDINQLAGDANLSLVQDHPMPANNQLIAFRKVEVDPKW